MYHYRLKVSYLGSHYYGWQDIAQGKDKPTIEGKINEVLQQICHYEPCTIATASRTDAGVHAQGQLIKVTLPRELVPEKLLRGMNSLLPDDIRILSSHSCAEDFNPNKDALRKFYDYYFSIAPIHNPLLNETVAHIPAYEGMELDILLMKEGSTYFIGTHDFYAFAKQDKGIYSTVRTVLRCEIVPATSPFGDIFYVIKVEGEGFLRYMIRYIAGALFALGRGQISLEDIAQALTSPSANKLSPKAKARGLHLMGIEYERF